MTTARKSKQRPTSATRDLALGPLPDTVGYALRRTQLAVFDYFRACFEPLQLRPAQFSALVLIEANPGCRQSDAAEALGIMQPNFVALMDELEMRNLARRTPAKTDRRSHALELTASGRTVLQRAKTAVAAHDARILSVLNEAERRQLFAMLARVETAAEAAADTAIIAPTEPRRRPKSHTNSSRRLV